MQSEENFVDNPLIKVYIHWINCTLCDCGEKIDNLTHGSFQNGIVLCKLIEQVTGCTLNPCLEPHSVEEKQQNVRLVLQFLESKGLEVNLQVEDVVAGDLRTLLDLLWLVILHFEIHSADRAAYQRTVSMGKRFLLEWSKKEVTDLIIDTRGSFAESFQSGVLLTRIISKYVQVNGAEHVCQFTLAERSDLLKRAFEAAERKFGIPANMLSSSDIVNGNADDYSLMIYVAMLRRKIKALKIESARGNLAVPEIEVEDPEKSPANGLNVPPSAQHSPLSPKTLKSLVEQQAKSSAAIQALQEQLRAATYSSLTPKSTKKITTASSCQPTLEVPCQTKATPVEQSSPCFGSTLPQDLQFLLSPQNISSAFPGLEEENSENMDSSERRKKVTSVDRRFMEFIMDAVQRGCIDDEFLDSDLRDLDPQDSTKSRSESEGAEDKKENSVDSVELMKQEKDVEETTAPENPSRSKDVDVVCGIDRKKCEEDEDMDTDSLQLKRKANEGQGNVETTTKSAKRAQCTGVENSIGDSLGKSEASKDSSSKNDLTESTAEKYRKTTPVQSTVTWATLNNSNVQSKGEVTPSASTADPSTDYPPHVTGTPEMRKKGDVDNVSVSEEDQFMAYLNSIEQSALMYKLQVEEAKIETLLTLKRKLEDAFEGTPLEQVPFRFREKLHDILHQVAEDHMSKYRDLTAESEVELDRSERDYVSGLQDELDQLTFENREIKQQLENLMESQNEYSELRTKIKELEDALFTMKSSYQYKNGESEFLAEKISSLDKQIFGMRIEYEQQLQDLRNENMDLQEICIELETENRTLLNNNENMRSGESSPSINSPRLSSPRGAKGYQIVRTEEYLNLEGEIENLQIRLEKSEKQVNALTVASEADQVVIRNLEGKIHDTEGALAHAQERHSNTLSEIHENQLQLASTRALLSGYKEEVEALRRENKLLKSSLATSENEVRYQNQKLTKRSEPWKQNKREIWREIRELENILKDVHKEKKNIEKKYVHFKTENEELNESLKELNKSLSRNSSPVGSSPKLHAETPSPKYIENAALSKVGRQTTTVSPWEKSFVDETADKLSSRENNNETPRRMGFNIMDNKNRNTSPLEKSAGDLSDELQTLRLHVGNLESEKAAILKELDIIRSPRVSS